MTAFVVTLSVSGALLWAGVDVPVPEDKPVGNPQSDFDFLLGRWKVHNRRLRERLKGSTVWDEFDGTAVVRPILGGKGNVNEYEAQGPSGPIEGFALRLFNPKSRQWSIYWASGDNGTLDLPPMIGAFEGGRGEFYNQEVFEGRSVYVRFVWSGITATSCRWEQAFSADRGKTWEVNWIMEFTRSAAGEPAESSSASRRRAGAAAPPSRRRPERTSRAPARRA